MLLYSTMIRCWPCTTITYEATTSSEIRPNDELIESIFEVRKKYGDFLYVIEDRAVKAISELYPELNGYESVIGIDEIRNESFPSAEILRARKKFFVFIAWLALIVTMAQQ